MWELGLVCVPRSCLRGYFQLAAVAPEGSPTNFVGGKYRYPGRPQRFRSTDLNLSNLKARCISGGTTLRAQAKGDENREPDEYQIARVCYPHAPQSREPFPGYTFHTDQFFFLMIFPVCRLSPLTCTPQGKKKKGSESPTTNPTTLHHNDHPLTHPCCKISLGRSLHL